MTARRTRRTERKRFARDVRRAIRDLPTVEPDEETLIAVEAALRATAPGVIPAASIRRLFRRRRDPGCPDPFHDHASTLENT